MFEWLKKLLFREKIVLPPSTWDFENEEIKPEDAVYGMVFGEVDFSGKPSRDWSAFLPTHEIQSWGDCVTFSRLNCAETKAIEDGVTINGKEVNFSDLYLAVKSGTTQNGNGLHQVAEYSRKYGVVLEEDCPYTTNWQERQRRVDAVPDTVTRYKLGNNAWLDRVNGEVPVNILKSALDHTPVQVGVGLGETYQNGGVIQKPRNVSVYHAMMCFYVDENNQKHCYDHYNRKVVVLSADYPILFAKSFRDLPENWKGIGVDASILHKRLLGKLIIRTEVDKGAAGELYRVYEDRLEHLKIRIGDKQLQEQVLHCIPAFYNITEAEFETLLEAVFVASGKKSKDDVITESAEAVDFGKTYLETIKK